MDSLIFADHPSHEPLAGLDDLDHPLFERRKIFRGERSFDVEVVIKTIFNGRPDPELGAREGVLNRLCEHMSCRVAQNG